MRAGAAVCVCMCVCLHVYAWRRACEGVGCAVLFCVRICVRVSARARLPLSVRVCSHNVVAHHSAVRARAV